MSRDAKALDEALEALRAASYRKLIPQVIPLAFVRDVNIASCAGAALARLLTKVPLLQLPSLDKRVRQMSFSQPHSVAWTKLTPAAVTEQAQRMGAALTTLCTFHPNGRVRAASVAALHKHFPDQSLPFLLIRLCDWVTEVRTQALNFLKQSTLQPGNEAHWWEGLALLESVENLAAAPFCPQR